MSGPLPHVQNLLHATREQFSEHSGYPGTKSPTNGMQSSVYNN